MRSETQELFCRHPRNRTSRKEPYLPPGQVRFHRLDLDLSALILQLLLDLFGRHTLSKWRCYNLVPNRGWRASRQQPVEKKRAA